MFRQRWEEIFEVGDSVALQIELLKRLVKDFSGDGVAWLKFGLALSEVARFREAESALRRALELCTDLVEAQRVLPVGRHVQVQG